MPCGRVNPTPRVFNGDSRVDSLWRLGGAPVTFLFCKPHPHPSFAYGAERSVPPFIAQTFFHWRLAGLCHGRPHRLGPKYALLSPTLCSSLSSSTKHRLSPPFGSPLSRRATCLLPLPACLRIPPHRTLFAKRYISRKPLSCIFRSYEVTLYMDTHFFPPPTPRPTSAFFF